MRMASVCWGLGALLCAAGVPAATVIHAGHLLAEPGRPMLERQSIVIDGGRIVAIKDGFVAGDPVVDLSHAYVLPGLIDMHTHITVQLDLNSPDPRSKFLQMFLGRPAAAVLQALPIARTVLNNGFTTIRALGDPSNVTYDLRNAIAAGLVDGPRILGVEPQFEVPGGDYHVSRYGERLELEPYFHNRGTCTGIEDCRRAVREEVARGADVIKFREAALPVLDPKVASVEYSEEILAIVQAAHKLNRTVAVHVNTTPEGNRMAIEAGADTIEHGPLDERAIDMMRKRGTAYTPTLYVQKVASDIQRRMGVTRDLYAESVASVAKAHAAGVMILFGTDIAAFPPGQAPEEFSELVAAGLSAADALRAATMNAAIKLHMEDQIGSIAPGKRADIIAVPGDPLADVKQMRAVHFVMQAGRIVKNTP